MSWTFLLETAFAFYLPAMPSDVTADDGRKISIMSSVSSTSTSRAASLRLSGWPSGCAAGKL